MPTESPNGSPPAEVQLFAGAGSDPNCLPHLAYAANAPAADAPLNVLDLPPLSKLEIDGWWNSYPAQSGSPEWVHAGERLQFKEREVLDTAQFLALVTTDSSEHAPNTSKQD